MASGKSKEELAKIGAKTRFKAGKKQAEIARQGAIVSMRLEEKSGQCVKLPK